MPLGDKNCVLTTWGKILSTRNYLFDANLAVSAYFTYGTLAQEACCVLFAGRKEQNFVVIAPRVLILHAEYSHKHLILFIN